MHQVAAGSLDIDEHDLDYLAQAHWSHFRYRFGEMTGLDRATKRVKLAATYDEDGREITPERWFSYDTLIIAIGTVSNDFDTPGVAQHAIALDTPEQATRFNRRLINACLRAHNPKRCDPGNSMLRSSARAPPAPNWPPSSTGRRAIVAYGLDRIDPEKDVKITLIEGADRILPALPERLSEATKRLLEQLKVHVRTSARVVEVRSDGVMLSNRDFVPSELVVWAAGVKGPGVLAALDGLEVSRNNQLVVTPTLQTTRDPNIFAMGDCAHFVPEGATAPFRLEPKLRISRLHISCARCGAGSPGSRSSPGVTATSALSSRSVSTARSAT